MTAEASHRTNSESLPFKAKDTGHHKEETALGLIALLVFGCCDPPSALRTFKMVILEIAWKEVLICKPTFFTFLFCTSPIDEINPILPAFLPPPLWLRKHLYGQETFLRLLAPIASSTKTSSERHQRTFLMGVPSCFQPPISPTESLPHLFWTVVSEPTRNYCLCLIWEGQTPCWWS